MDRAKSVEEIFVRVIPYVLNCFGSHERVPKHGVAPPAGFSVFQAVFTVLRHLGGAVSYFGAKLEPSRQLV